MLILKTTVSEEANYTVQIINLVMRKLFCEQARSFFKSQLKVDIEAKNHFIKLTEQLAAKNIMKSKVINLLPKEDLEVVASHPCFLRFREEFV